MGFRDIELFNLVLLARQAWCTLRDPNSLNACFLKARYFPDTDFLQAKLVGAPSQIWRVILVERHVFAQGLIRRIGDGHSIDIWRHNWLPRDYNMGTCLSDKPPSVC